MACHCVGGRLGVVVDVVAVSPLVAAAGQLVAAAIDAAVVAAVSRGQNCEAILALHNSWRNFALLVHVRYC